jgi:hypothetical protein
MSELTAEQVMAYAQAAEDTGVPAPWHVQKKMHKQSRYSFARQIVGPANAKGWHTIVLHPSDLDSDVYEDGQGPGLILGGSRTTIEWLASARSTIPALCESHEALRVQRDALLAACKLVLSGLSETHGFETPKKILPKIPNDP